MKPIKAVPLLIILLGLTRAVFGDSTLYQQQCAGCHLADARGNPDLGAPNLTGLSEAYLGRQLRNFRSGVRGDDERDSGGSMMRAVASRLSDEQIASLSSYVAGQAFFSAPAMSGRGGLMGRGLYSGCKSCHGSAGEGIEALNAPRLAGQYGDYLALQLANFRDGIRGNRPEDKYGHQMAVIAKTLQDQESIKSLVEYISHLED